MEEIDKNPEQPTKVGETDTLLEVLPEEIKEKAAEILKYLKKCPISVSGTDHSVIYEVYPVSACNALNNFVTILFRKWKVVH